MHDVEIICGARRLYAARHLNIDIAIELRDLSDRAGIVLLDIENRQRRDWSAYERGRSFASWLSAGFFESQDDLARSLNISASQVSRLLKMARLPAVVVGAFSDPGDICEMWGLDLYRACEDTQSKSRIIARARSIKAQGAKLEARDVFNRLRLDSRSALTQKQHKYEVVVGQRGETLFRIKHQEKTVAVLIDKQNISSESLGRIKEALLEILQDASAQVLVELRDSVATSNFRRTGQSSLPAV
jgi:ParB family chromosome partitioning protein